MSLLADALKNEVIYKEILEASDGLFLTVCDSLDFDSFANYVKSLNGLQKPDAIRKYGILKNAIPEEINRHFESYKKLKARDIYDHVKEHINTPIIKNVIQVNGDDKIVNADLMMEVQLDTNDYITDRFYKYFVPFEERTFFETDARFKTINYYIEVSFSIDNAIKKFKIHNLLVNKPEERKVGISFSANMVPNIKTKDLPLLTKLFIDKYDIDSPVDIEKTIYNIGLNVDDSYALNGTDALITFNDGDILVNGTFISAKANTIYVDSSLKERKGIGAYRFALLHEAVHFEYHLYYLTLRKIVKNEKYAYSLLKMENNKYADPNRIEWQANNVAGRVLVPTEELDRLLVEKINKYNFYTSNDRETLLIKICKELSKYFNSSYQVMAYRINALNMFDIKLPVTETTIITNEELEKICETNEKVKYLIDTKKVVHRHNRCVINNRKYVNDYGITYYAYHNPKESMLIFTKFSNYGNSNIYYLERKASTKDLAENVKQNKEINEFLGIENLQDIVNEDSYRNLMRNTVGETIKNIRLTKKIGIGTLAIRTELSEHTIMQIEEDEYPTNIVVALAKICKVLYLPLDVTLNIYSKLKIDFDDYWESKIVYKMLIKFYEKDTEEEFIERVGKVKEIAKTIEENNVVFK